LLECQYLGCSNPLKKGAYTCVEHSCSNVKCTNPINIEIQKYCSRCVCLWRNCKEFKENQEWCKKHTCDHKGCEEGARTYCEDHRCSFEKCDQHINSNKENDKNYCINHQCKVLDCEEQRKIQTPPRYWYHQNEFCSKHGEYCVNHSCKGHDCFNKSRNDSKHCSRHSCVLKHCYNSAGQFICYDHEESRVIKCSKWHIKKGGYKNDQMMKLSYYLECKQVDLKLLWLNLCANEDYIEFVSGFKKQMWIALSGWKNNGVCKDIREIIFYEYLKQTIIYYFDKKCYDCVRICSLGCGEIWWPYNPNCKTHVCSKDQCHKLKYKELNVCLEHKCHRDKCNNETYKNTKFCNSHLCPLCRIGGTFKSNNFCKQCSCKKRIPNEYGTVFCSNPKIFGSKDGFCMDHAL